MKEVIALVVRENIFLFACAGLNCIWYWTVNLLKWIDSCIWHGYCIWNIALHTYIYIYIDIYVYMQIENWWLEAKRCNSALSLVVRNAVWNMFLQCLWLRVHEENMWEEAKKAIVTSFVQYHECLVWNTMRQGRNICNARLRSIQGRNSAAKFFSAVRTQLRAVLRPAQEAMASSQDVEYVFRLATRVARQLPPEHQQNFQGAVNLARSGIISIERLMDMLDEIDGASQVSQPSQAPQPRQAPSFLDVAMGSVPAALRPGCSATPQAHSPFPGGKGPVQPMQQAETFVGWPDAQPSPLTWSNVQAFLEGKAEGKAQGKGGRGRGSGGDGKGGRGGKGKKDRPRAANLEVAQRRLDEFLERYPNFVFRPRDDCSQRVGELWSALDEDRDNLARALQKHFVTAPEVLEDIVSEMVIHTHWPVDKNNVMEKESKAKRQNNADGNTFISKMSNLSNRTTRRYWPVFWPFEGCTCAAMSHVRFRREQSGKRMYVCCYEPHAFQGGVGRKENVCVLLWATCVALSDMRAPKV